MKNSIDRIFFALCFSLCAISCSQRDASSPEAILNSNGVPTELQIKQDLLGNTIGSPLRGWHFSSMAEFSKFDIVSVEDMDGTLQIVCDTLLYDAGVGKTFSADLTVVYRKIDGDWKFVSVSDMGTFRPAT